MKNWFIGRVLAFIGRKLDGKKTKIAGAMGILYGLAGFYNLMFPDSPIPGPKTFEESWGAIAAGMVAIGIHGKAEKIIAACGSAQNERAQKNIGDPKAEADVHSPAGGV